MRTVGQYSLLLVLLLAGCQQAETPSSQPQVISTDAAPAAIGPYSQARVVGNTIYCSGQIGIDPETGDLVDGGIEAETRQVLDNLSAVLEAAGASLDDVVQAQVYLANLDDYGAMNEVYGQYFEESPPARAAVEVSRIPAGARIEIMVTAVKSSASSSSEH